MKKDTFPFRVVHSGFCVWGKPYWKLATTKKLRPFDIESHVASAHHFSFNKTMQTTDASCQRLVQSISMYLYIFYKTRRSKNLHVGWRWGFNKIIKYLQLEQCECINYSVSCFLLRMFHRHDRIKRLRKVPVAKHRLKIIIIMVNIVFFCSFHRDETQLKKLNTFS